MADGLEHIDHESALALALLDRNAAIRQIVTAIPGAVGVPIGFAALVVDDLDTVQIVATVGTWGLTDLLIPTGRGLGGRVAALRHPLAVADYVAATEITHDFDEDITGEGIRALAAAPISHGHEFLGVLYAGSREAGELKPDQIQGLTRLARQVGLALGVADHARSMIDVAVHEERRRVALSLHDSLGSTLFTLGAAIRSLRAETEPEAHIAERLAYMEELTAIASATIRRTMLALNSHPDQLALGVALQADCRAFTERTGIQASSLVLGTLPHLPPTQTRELLMTTREALLNVEKHAGARSVIVSSHAVKNGVEVVIADDGVGLGIRAEGRRNGLGLQAAGERLTRLGGRLLVSDGDEGGCLVRAWAPC